MDKIESNKRVHVIVSGRVQGVNFRYATEKKAKSLGLTGWVRNLHDGRVEAVFEGNTESIGAMLKWCYLGPSLAKVTAVETREERPTERFDDFRIVF